jgi:hypothetical protein
MAQTLESLPRKPVDNVERSTLSYLNAAIRALAERVATNPADSNSIATLAAHICEKKHLLYGLGFENMFRNRTVQSKLQACTMIVLNAIKKCLALTNNDIKACIEGV